MTTEDSLKRIKDELHEVIVACHKTRADLMEDLGLSINYLDAAWARNNLKLRTLFQILEAAGEEPLPFFVRALRREMDLDRVSDHPEVEAALKRFNREYEECP